MAVACSGRRWSAKQVVPWLVLGTGLALVAANVLYVALALGPEVKASPGAAAAEPPAGASGPAAVTTVSLPEGKFREAHLATAAVETATLPTEVGVAGRIEANTDRRVEIRPRAAGVVRAVHVALGQTVKKGDPLVTLDSPDVGKARLDLRARQRELGIARVEADWKNQIAANVAQLIPELSKGVPAAVIEKKYADRQLGANRATLLQAYTEREIALHEEEKTTGLFKEKIVGEHPYFLAVHTLEGAKAKFEAALEQVRYDAAQQKRVADQQVRTAEADVIDAAQRLRILGVSEDIKALLANASDVSGTDPGEDVTAYEIAAPFDGTIIAKRAVPSQKADMMDSLFTLADLSDVWVTANVPESDFALIPALSKGKIRVTAAAYPGRTFEAKLLSVGAMVDPATRAVPLLAGAPNPDGALKLGMFARIVLDTARTEPVLTVPAASVVEIDGKSGVFVPAAEPRTFTFHPVTVGRQAGDRAVIAAGLREGDKIVSAGAFLLKSELILQNETDEE